MIKLRNNYEEMYNNIQAEVNSYLANNPGIESLVLGISGGIDSAIVAAIAAPICRDIGIPLIGRSITIETNKEDEIERAREIGKHFCTDFKELDLTDAYLNLAQELDVPGDNNEWDYKIAEGNIKARLRMIQLYNLAGLTKGMVLSTDNYTEFLLGFWTLHGDVGDYGMIQNIWKTEVYGLADWVAGQLPFFPAQALRKCIKAVPTDGLGITDSDLDQLEAETYEEVDMILIDYLNLGHAVPELSDNPVIARHLNTQFKRENPYNIPRKKVLWG